MNQKRELLTPEQRVGAYTKASSEIDALNQEIGAHFARSYDPALYDGTMRILIKKLDRAYASFAKARSNLIV